MLDDASFLHFLGGKLHSCEMSEVLKKKKNNHWTHQGTAWRHISSFFKLFFSKSSRRPWIPSRCVVPSWVQKTKNRISTWWFNPNFCWYPIWRSLGIWKVLLMIPKRSQKIARRGWFMMSFLDVLVDPFKKSSSNVMKIHEIVVEEGRTGFHLFGLHEVWASIRVLTHGKLGNCEN